MNLVCFLKLLTDLCYYGVFAAFFAGVYGLEGSVLPQFALLALAGALCRMAERRFPQSLLRLAPLLLMPLAFALPAQTAGLVIVTPAALYVLWTVCTRRFDPSYYQCADQFRLELKILILPFMMALVFLQLKRVEQFSVPYLLVFLFGSVLLLRMLRHDEATLRQPRFRLMNGLTMVGLSLVCLFLSSTLFRQAVGMAIKGIWSVVSIPIFLVVVLVGGGLAVLIDFVMPDDFHFDPVVLEGLFPDLGEEGDQQRQEMLEAATETNPVISYIYTALLILLAIVAMVLLFRWLAAKRTRSTQSESHATRYAAAPMQPREKPLTRLSARTPQLQVRYWYQQLLHHTRQEGGNLDAAMNTRQQQQVGETVLKDHDALSRLRQLYLPARYKDQATQEDAREARELFQQLKK